jgi:hypothetical protein
MANVRARSSAHGRYVEPACFVESAGEAFAVSLISGAAASGRGAMRARHALAGANTPAYLTV